MKSFFNTLLYTFVLSTFLKPAGFDIMGMDGINTFFNVARICFAPFVLILYFRTFHWFSAFIKTEILFVSVLFIPTYFYNPEELSKYFIWAISIVLFSCLVDVLVRRNYKIFIYSLFINYFILIVGNLFWMVNFVGHYMVEAVPDNSSTISFLASDNMTASYIFPAFCSAFLLSLLTKNKYNIFSLILYVTIVLSVLMLWSATSLSGVFLLLFYVFFIYDTRYENRFASKYIIVFSLIIMVGVTFFNIQEFFSFIIVDILHKDVSMTGRTDLWQMRLNDFWRSPVFGCGFRSGICDNGLVQILLNGGIIWLLTYILLLKRSLMLFWYVHNDSLVKYFAVVISVIFIMYISESWVNFFGFYVILSLLINSNKLSSKLK